MLWRNINIQTPTQVGTPRRNRKSRYTPTRSDGNNSRILSTSFEDRRNDSSCDKRSEKNEENLGNSKNIVKRVVQFRVTQEWIIKIKRQMSKLIKINKSLCELVKMQMGGVKEMLVKDLKTIEQGMAQKMEEMLKFGLETPLREQQSSGPKNNFISPVQIKKNPQNYQITEILTPQQLLLKPIALTKCFLNDESFGTSQKNYQRNNTIDGILEELSPGLQIGEKKINENIKNQEVGKRSKSIEIGEQKIDKVSTMKKILNVNNITDIQSTLHLITAKKYRNKKKDVPLSSQTSILKGQTKRQVSNQSHVNSLPSLNLQISTDHESNKKQIKTEREMNNKYIPSRRLSESVKKQDGKEAMENMSSCIENMKKLLSVQRLMDPLC